MPYMEYERAYWTSSFPITFQEKKHNYFTRLTKNNDIICLQEIHGKDEFLQAIQVLVPQFRLFGTFIPYNLNAGGSAVCIHKNLVPEGAIVTHAVTCQGRDYIVDIQSGDRNLVFCQHSLRARLDLEEPS